MVSWTGKINIPPSPRVPENLVSRDGFSRPAHLHSGWIWCLLLRDSSRVPRRRPFMKPPYAIGSVPSLSGQRTDGVHCRESAGTGPVNLKVVPNECCLGRSPWTNYYSPLFPTPTIGMKWACWKYRRWSTRERNGWILLARKNEHRRRKVDKSCVTFLLCYPGWYVHKPDVQNKLDDTLYSRKRGRFGWKEGKM